MEGSPTLEFFGATTFRLRASGLTIFHDTWLRRPSLMPAYLNLDDVTDVDYILISHAHFDHLPGADIIAKRMGAIIIANCEAINRLRDSGVPEEQLLPVSGGERIPLFTRAVREAAAAGKVSLRAGPPGAPVMPDWKLATAQIHVWPALHCLFPGSHDDIPEVFDTGEVYEGSSSPFESTLDITRGMKYGLFRLKELVPENAQDEKMKSFIDWIEDKKLNIMSHCDGGQLMFNILLQEKTILFNSHLGAYEGIVKSIEPKPDVAVLGIAGRANLNGRPFDGSGAMFATKLTQWLGEPENVIWCLHDECLIKPYIVDTKAATLAVEASTRSRITELVPNQLYPLFAIQ